MKTFNSIEELKPYYNEETNTYVFNDDVAFNFSLIIDSNIEAYDIEAHNIEACDIKARNVNARNIDALDIKACDIKSRDIKAWNIAVRDISYYAVCIAYQSFVCESVKGRRRNPIHECLDGDVIIKKPKQTITLELTDEQLDKIKKLLEE